MSRILDLTIEREPVAIESEFVRYWRDHAPDANDLAELFKISPRRVRQLWQEGWLTKGGDLPRVLNEWRTYRHHVERAGLGGQKPGGQRG